MLKATGNFRRLEIPPLSGGAVILEGALLSDGLRLAARRLCPQTPSCSSNTISQTCVCCQRVAENDHPDVFVLDGAETKDQVERVRHMRASAFIRPRLADACVFILLHAESLSEASQNALLKVIEEPPPYALFLLLAARAESLLPTVRSRCALYRLAAQENAVAVNGGNGGDSAAFMKALSAPPAHRELEVCRVIMGWTRLNRTEFAALLEDLLPRLTETGERYDPVLAETVLELLDAQRQNLGVSAACAKLLSLAPGRERKLSI